MNSDLRERDLAMDKVSNDLLASSMASRSQLTLSKTDCLSVSSAVTTSASANSGFIAPSVYAKVSPDATISQYL
jgi:hypothetical protein